MKMTGAESCQKELYQTKANEDKLHLIKAANDKNALALANQTSIPVVRHCTPIFALIKEPRTMPQQNEQKKKENQEPKKENLEPLLSDSSDYSDAENEKP